MPSQSHKAKRSNDGRKTTDLAAKIARLQANIVLLEEVITAANGEIQKQRKLIGALLAHNERVTA